MEKFLSNSPAKNPIIPNVAAFAPTLLPNSKSSINPITIPYIVPIVLVENNPINNVNIINKLGNIPAMLNHVKKFDCK